MHIFDHINVSGFQNFANNKFEMKTFLKYTHINPLFFFYYRPFRDNCDSALLQGNLIYFAKVIVGR